MLKFIGSSGLVLFFLMVGLIFVPLNLGETGLFAVFMTYNWMNLFRARSFGKNIGAFASLSRNKLFILVSAGILIANILIVQFGGSIFGTEALNVLQWLEVCGISLGAILLSSYINKVIK